MSKGKNEPDEPASAGSVQNSDSVKADHDRAALNARAELLAEENRRLRTEYARARKSTYQRTAFWLVVVGVVAVVGGLLVSDSRQILFTLGAIGLFGGIFTYYLTPGQFVAADIGERVYAASASNWCAITDELGLQNEYIYLPSDGRLPAHLFVPQRTGYTLPDDRSSPITTHSDEQGFVLEPTGAGLFEEFDHALIDSLATDLAPLAAQLADGLVEQFELAKSAEPDIDPAGGRVTVAIEASAYGDIDRFDHPAASFLAVGFAEGLEKPIELTVDTGDGQADWLVTCRWEQD